MKVSHGKVVKKYGSINFFFLLVLDDWSGLEIEVLVPAMEKKMDKYVFLKLFLWVTRISLMAAHIQRIFLILYTLEAPYFTI